jgi:hypothetical protein
MLENIVPLNHLRSKPDLGFKLKQVHATRPFCMTTQQTAKFIIHSRIYSNKQIYLFFQQNSPTTFVCENLSLV